MRALPLIDRLRIIEYQVRISCFLVAKASHFSLCRLVGFGDMSLLSAEAVRLRPLPLPSSSALSVPTEDEKNGRKSLGNCYTGLYNHNSPFVSLTLNGTVADIQAAIERRKSFPCEQGGYISLILFYVLQYLCNSSPMVVGDRVSPLELSVNAGMSQVCNRLVTVWLQCVKNVSG